MQRKILTLFTSLVLSLSAYSQVGINTATPKATLDVVGKTLDGTRPEGIIAPRLTGDALFAASGNAQYGSDQDGAIVYVTAPVSLGNNVGQTINIDNLGYYYFDALANQWKKLGYDSTIYTTDGTLTSPRTMDMDNSTLGFVNGRVGIGINASHPSSILELKSTTRGFLPPRMTKAQMDAIVSPSLALMVYCTDCFPSKPYPGCLMINDSSVETSPVWGSLCSSNSPAPIVLALNCSSATTTGNLYQGQPASGVTTTVPYDGGNGGSYPAGSFQSTGVSGLTANLSAGSLNNGPGNLTFTIAGTPASTGTATFAITVAGQSCSFGIPVATLSASVSSLNCGSAVFAPATFTQNTNYTGTLTVPYTGGSGGNYPQQQFTQNGLIFTRPAGTISTSGSFVYNISGSPTASGAMSVPISFPGATSCNVNTTVGTNNTLVMCGNPQAWMRHNLGADTSLDPDVPVQGIHGNYYQWGRSAVVANASTPSGAISGWNTTNAPSNSWQDGTKTVNDPCPSGFRVPTRQQLQNLMNNTTASNIGTFTGGDTNFGSAKVLSCNGKKLTLPTAGYRIESSELRYRGIYGGYWSSTQYTADRSNILFFSSTGVSMNYGMKAGGFSIRCISE